MFWKWISQIKLENQNSIPEKQFGIPILETKSRNLFIKEF